MDPSSNQQAAPAIKHMMTVPEKIELTSTGAYPSPPRAAGGQRAGDFRAMRIPDKIMLETAGRGDEGEGGGVSGAYFQQPREPPLEVPTPRPEPFATSTVSVAELQGLERRLGNLESQVKGLRRAVLQQAGGGGGGGRRSEGSRVWYALTFAGWLMVPLVVVFMFHYRKTA